VSSLQVTGSQIVSDVIPNIASMRFGAIEWIKGFDAIMVQKARITERKPRGFKVAEATNA
jgi:hypothetical protein